MVENTEVAMSIYNDVITYVLEERVSNPVYSGDWESLDVQSRVCRWSSVSRLRR